MEPTPRYEVTPMSAWTASGPLPRRALNLARRLLQLERECNGRGRVECQIVMLDGEWLLMVSTPGPVERLGE